MTARIGKLIRLLSSDRPGEVVAAAGAINRALQAAGLDIHRLAEVIERSPLDDPGQMPDADGWRAMRRFCAERAARLSAREQQFIADLKYWHRPTPKQCEWLTIIYRRLRSEAA
jgi:hypothetical protein